jgi:hypothetical protein
MKTIKKEITADITDLPSNISELLYKEAGERGLGQNSYMTVYVHGTQKPRSEYKGGEILFVDPSCDYIVERGDDIISDYFYDKEGLKNRETILLKICW